MFGNKLGWLLAGAELVIVGLVIYLLAVEATKLTPPTNDFEPGSIGLAKLELPTSPQSVVPAALSDSCDSADLYKQAIAEYQSNAKAYDVAADKPLQADPTKLPALDFLLKATACSKMSLFEAKPGEIVNYSPDRAQVDALQKLGEACANAGVLVGAKEQNAGKAIKYFEASFSLGAKLFNDRLVYQEMFAGMGLMGKSASGLARTYEKLGNMPMANQLKQFDQSRQEYFTKRIQPTWQIISSVSEGTIGARAGDVFALARSSQDRMWRVEATLKLGRYRFNASRSGDQRGAIREVRKMADDPQEDPAVRAAAAAARDLTIEDYRMLR